MRKVYVDVEVRWNKDGTIIPIALWWEQGNYEPTVFTIDRVISGPVSRNAPSGGVGKRYEVEISGNRRYLYLQKDRWFIETDR